MPSTKTRVGMILETPFPPDARVEREALSLIEAGYEVHILCRKDKRHDTPTEMYQGIHVHRVEPNDVCWKISLPGDILQLKSRTLYRGIFKSFWRWLTGEERDWKPLIKAFVTRQKIQILHVHDLKLLETAQRVAEQQGNIKIISDLHENYPALIGRLVSKRKGEQVGKRKRRWWKAVERRALPKADHVIVVVDEAQKRLTRSTDLTESRISVVQNVVDGDKFLAADPDALSEAEKALMHGRYILCYVGHVNSDHRGVQTVIKALPALEKQIPNILFMVVGSTRKDYLENTLTPLVHKLGVSSLVHFTGYRDESAFVPYIQRAHIGVCPHLKTVLTDTTFPNKVFIYGLFQKPVLVSHCRPLARYVEDTQSGVVFTSNDPDSFTESVLALYNAPQTAITLGENGYRAVQERYQWRHEKQHLLEVYQNL